MSSIYSVKLGKIIKEFGLEVLRGARAMRTAPLRRRTSTALASS